jgi:hypothetical protein
MIKKEQLTNYMIYLPDFPLRLAVFSDIICV